MRQCYVYAPQNAPQRRPNKRKLTPETNRKTLETQNTNASWRRPPKICTTNTPRACNAGESKSRRSARRGKASGVVAVYVCVSVCGGCQQHTHSHTYSTDTLTGAQNWPFTPLLHCASGFFENCRTLSTFT